MKCPMCSTEISDNQKLKGQCDDCGNWDDEDIGCKIEDKIMGIQRLLKTEFDFLKNIDFGTERPCPYHIEKETDCTISYKPKEICMHERGEYKIIPFGIFARKVYICFDCYTVLFGKRLKLWEKNRY